MKRSDKVALGMSGLTIGVGLVSAVLCPVIGLGLGAYLTYGAVAATMGTGATVALTAAGGVGGLFLGKIAAPIVGWGSVGLGMLVGGLTKMVSGLFDKSSKADAPQRTHGFGRDATATRRLNTKVKLTGSFNDGRRAVNENKKAPAPKKANGFDL